MGKLSNNQSLPQKHLGRALEKFSNNLNKNLDNRFEEQARMIKRGFDDVDKRFDGVDKRFDSVEARLDNLEKGQEEIKLRLDQVAYRFELQDLEKRFEKRLRKVELKLGLRKS